VRSCSAASRGMLFRASGSSSTTRSTTRLPWYSCPTRVPAYAAWIACSTCAGCNPRPDRRSWRSRMLSSAVPGGAWSWTSRAPGERRHDPRHRLRVAIERIEVRAVQGDDERRREASQRFLDALGEERVHRERHAGKSSLSSTGKRLADLPQDALLRRAFDRADLDLELAVVSAEGVRAPGLATHPLRDRLDAVDREQRLGDALADSHRLRLRGAGNRRHVDDVVPLPQRRDEFAR